MIGLPWEIRWNATPTKRGVLFKIKQFQYYRLWFWARH